MNFSLVLWSLYLLIFPFYFAPEGYPQIADAIGVLLLLVNFREVITTIFKNDYNRFLFFFVLYTIIINTVWMVTTGELLFLKSSLYYLYAFLLFVFVFSKLNDEKFVRTTVKLFLVSLIIQLVLWPIIPDQGVRYQMFFNNPNQLALWCLCIIVISNALHIKYNFSLKLIVPISLFGTLFILLSASRSGVFCVALFWLFFYLKSMRNLIALSIILGVIIIFTSISNLIKFEDLTIINYMIERISGVQPHDAGLDERGYDRILDFPEYLVFGAGEGLMSRFNTTIELHSTFFNVLFSYGIIGLVLFGRSLISIVINSYRQIIVLFMVIAIFGHVHMTLRIPMFWMTLGVLFFIRQNKFADIDEDKKNKAIKPKAPTHLKPIQF